MKNEILIEESALAFIRRQPPETKKNLRSVIHALERGEYLIEPLEDDLAGFYKVKFDDIRLILQSASGESGPGYKVVYAERRKTIYDEFKIILGLK